jgi:Fur family transcriptional regulator, ferric uptake regulator
VVIFIGASYSVTALPMPPAKPTLASSPHQVQLRQAGLRVTESRLAVLNFLSQQAAPLSHPDVVTALEGQQFDRATLYRNLIDMTEAGLLQRRDYGDHVWRFELAHHSSQASNASHPAHPHFVCDTCGTVSCMPQLQVNMQVMPSAPSPELPTPLLPQVSEILLKGQCAPCGTPVSP